MTLAHQALRVYLGTDNPEYDGTRPTEVRNLATNPELGTGTTGWSATAGTGSRYTVVPKPEHATYGYRATNTGSLGATVGLAFTSGADETAQLRGAPATWSVTLVSSTTTTATLSLSYRGTGPFPEQLQLGTVELTAWQPARVSFTATLPETMPGSDGDPVRQVGLTAEALESAGAYLGATELMVNTGAQALDYFTGATELRTDTAAGLIYAHQWTGTAHASTSRRFVTARDVTPAVVSVETHRRVAMLGAKAAEAETGTAQVVLRSDQAGAEGGPLVVVDATVDRPLLTGWLDPTRTEYARQADGTLVPYTTFTAVDNTEQLANQTRYGVSHAGEQTTPQRLAALMASAPWLGHYYTNLPADDPGHQPNAWETSLANHLTATVVPNHAGWCVVATGDRVRVTGLTGQAPTAATFTDDTDAQPGWAYTALEYGRDSRTLPTQVRLTNHGRDAEGNTDDGGAVRALPWVTRRPRPFSVDTSVPAGAVLTVALSLLHDPSAGMTADRPRPTSVTLNAARHGYPTQLELLDRAVVRFEGTSYPCLVTGIHHHASAERWSVTYDLAGLTDQAPTT